MTLHRLLLRQLNRTGLNADAPPTDVEAWHRFLNRMSQVYFDIDQERYYLERSMDISSREMTDLNKKLETAQHIGKMGYWQYDVAKQEFSWSKELYLLFNLTPGEELPSIQQLRAMMHKNDAPLLGKALENLTTSGQFEFEFRLCKLNNEEYRWYHVIGHVLSGKEKLNELKEGIISGIILDITTRKRAEIKLRELQQQLIATARKSGMSDVAKSVLHNIGNILNSANVSVTVIAEQLEKPIFEKINRIGVMLHENKNDIANYLSNNEQGKLIPEFLPHAFHEIDDMRSGVKNETILLNRQMKHIKDIVAMQYTLSETSSMVEKISISEMIDTALSIAGILPNHTNITIKKEFDNDFFLYSDRNKLMQILINLLNNAKDSLRDANKIQPNNKMEIAINVIKTASNELEMIFADSGIGIEPNNLTKIFSLGYTTKPEGHGYGLHSSALASNELGGTLTAQSKGILKGAAFTLKLPIEYTTRSEADDELNELNFK